MTILACGNWIPCELVMRNQKLKISLLAFYPASCLASTGGLGSILLGYLSIFVLIPILIIFPPIKLLYLSKKNKRQKKIARINLAISILSLALLFVLATQYFSFNFKPPYKNEIWESLFLLAIPTFILWFVSRRNNSNAD